jgi:hypothetical protein
VLAAIIYGASGPFSNGGSQFFKQTVTYRRPPSRKALNISGIYLLHNVFSVGLVLFGGIVKPYHHRAALISRTKTCRIATVGSITSQAEANGYHCKMD